MKQIMKEMDGKQIVLSPRTHNFRGLHKEKAAKDSKQVWSGTEEGYPRERGAVEAAWTILQRGAMLLLVGDWRCGGLSSWIPHERLI